MPDEFVANVEMVGTQELVEILLKNSTDIPRQLAGALLDEAHIIFRISQVQVPFRTGVLKGSGRVGVPEIVGTTVSVDISYGGAAMAYAWIQHNYELHHNNGKKWHYLSDPVHDREPFLADNIVARINLATRKA